MMIVKMKFLFVGLIAGILFEDAICSEVEIRKAISEEVNANIKTCKRQLTKCNGSPDRCVLDIPCDHGKCNEAGYCVCDPCWDGESCDDFLDLWLPSFDAREASVVVDNPWNDRPVFHANAADRDINSTCLGISKEACSCSQVSYSFISGNHKEVFTLDEATGELYIRDPTAFVERGVFHLEIGAWSKSNGDNETEADSALMLAVIAKSKDSDFHHQNHIDVERRRQKREADIVDSMTPPEETSNYKTDFKLNLKNGEPSSMEIGRLLEFEMVVSVPATERLDLMLDIFTKDVVADSYNPILAVFNIDIRTPPEMTLSNGEPLVTKILSSQQGSNVYDRVLIDFGEILNPDTVRQIIITFSVTAVRVKSTFKVHYVTVGAEYDFETYVWIAQTEVTLNTVKPHEDEKVVEADLDGPREIALDSAGVFTIDAYMKIRSDKVIITLKGPTTLEDVISVGNLGVSGFGDNFKCVPNDVTHYRAINTPSATKESFSAAKIDLGILTNTGSIYQKARNNENKVSFTFGLFALTRTDTVGNTEALTVAIEVGGKALWQETFYVNVTERNDNETLNNIEDSRVAVAPSRALLGDLLQYEVHLNVTSAAFTQIYIVQEYDPSNPITLCSARFDRSKSGFNIIWANSTAAKAVNSDDLVMIDMGRIYASEQRSGANTIDNTLVMNVYFFIDPEVPDLNLKDGNLQPIKVKIGKKEDPLVVNFEAIPLEPKRYTNPPEVKTEDAVAWREIYVGGAVAYDIIITMPLNSYFSNLSLSVTDLSNIEMPGAHICRARVSHIGRGLPCAQSVRGQINDNSIAYTKLQPERDDVDSVLVQFDRLCHVPMSQGNQTESQVIINIVANLQGEQSFQNGQPFALRTVLSLNSKAIHSEDKKFAASRPPSKDFLKNQPAFLYFQSLQPSFVPGGVGEVEIVLKTPPRSMALYLIELTTNDPDVSICILKIKSIGDSMPCIEEATPADYSLHTDPDNGNKKASLAINALANVGTYPMKMGRFLDPNSLVLSAIVKIGEKSTRSKSIKLKISFGSKGQIEDTIVLNVSPSKNATALQASAGGLSQRPRKLELAPHEEKMKTISAGSMSLMTMTAELVEFSSSRLKFDLLLDDGPVRFDDLEVCHEGISHLGKNYPCSSPDQWHKDVEGDNTFGLYNIGLLCNSFIERKKPEDNFIKFTIPVMLKSSAKYSEGTQMSFTSNIVTSGGGKESQAIQLEVTSTPVQTVGSFQQPSVKPTGNGEVSIGIRQRRWVSYNITVPKGSMTEVRVHVQGSKSDKVAIVVIHDMRITAVGRNIPCYRAQKLNVNLTSSFKNVQNDVGSSTLGYFTNPGYSHVRGRYQQGDDDIVFEILTEMTDHETTDDGSKHPVLLKVEMFEWSGSSQQQLVVVRTGKEATQIDVKLTVDGNRAYERAEAISVMAELKHFPSSFMEPTKMSLRIFLPQFVTFEAINDVKSGSNYVPELKNVSNGVDIIFPKLLFADEVRVNFTLLSDPENKRGYGTGQIIATSPYRVECEYNSRGQQTIEPYCSEQHNLNYNINSDECVINLGMEDSTIKDCQITASSSVDFDHAPFQARKGSPKAWSPAIKHGMEPAYLDIAFLRVTRVSQLEVIYITGTRRVHKYRLKISNDGRNWVDHGEVRTLDYQNGVAMDRLPDALQARHMRFVVVDAADEHVAHDLHVGVQIEIYGCYIGPFSEEENCQDDSTWYTNLESDKSRHSAVDTTTDIAYFCDYSDLSGKACMTSTDGGVTWKLQQGHIGSILGYDATKGVMYAQDRFNGSLFASEDGKSWRSVRPKDMSPAALTKSVVIPARGRNALLGKEEFNFGKWKAGYEGMYYSDAETPSPQWSQCCNTRGSGITLEPSATAPTATEG